MLIGNSWNMNLAAACSLNFIFWCMLEYRYFLSDVTPCYNIPIQNNLRVIFKMLHFNYISDKNNWIQIAILHRAV